MVRPTCGRCGVYRAIHPTNRCAKPRVSFWWDRHSPVRHVAGLAWLAFPDSVRWRVVSWMYNRHPNLCWCEFVDSAYLDAKKPDYRGANGCGCDVPIPTEVGEPRPGWCYCPPSPKGI
jgi:hypothetical protein